MSTEKLRAKRRLLFALLAETGTHQHLDSMLASYEVSSVKDLTSSQLNELITTLQEKRPTDDNVLTLKRWRSNILTVLTDMGVFKNNNWNEVNEFLMQKKIAGKKLYEMTIPELQQLNVKLKAMQSAGYSKVQFVFSVN